MLKSRIRLLAYAGGAKPNPKMGQALGPLGINMAQFCKDFNAATSQYNQDVLLRIKLKAYTDRTYKYEIKPPPTSWFIKKAIGKETLSGHKQVRSGRIDIKYIYEIAKVKQELDSELKDVALQSICKTIIAQCKTMNIDIDFEQTPPECIVPNMGIKFFLINFFIIIMSVIVAVRVRPFNQREKNLNSKLCIQMENNTTILIDEQGNERKFTFDHSFWSHDEYDINEFEEYVPKNEKYADQKYVYNQLGKQVLQNSLNGYHCCLFAYGQTGSGKSYSMIGYEKNRGIVPIISEEIFQKVNEQTNDNKWFEVNIQMLEIYNEKVQDLLVHTSQRVQTGLKIRESKTLGVYVENLSKHPVDSYSAIERKMNIGNTNKTIASTQMNASSSRSHTIIQIEFKQIEIISNKKVQRLSVINLVDLAGSEKLSKTGATGDRLKEGCLINKSLTVLGKVISVLADQSQGKGKDRVVPYRESSLTKILKNALGGNSKTLMICALSPAQDNYDETLSTLRYADRAKRITCHAIINESDTDKKIRQLQKENLELKQLILEMQQGNLKNLDNVKDVLDFEDKNDDLDQEEEKVQLENQIKQLQQALESHNKLILDYEQSFEQKLNQEKQNNQIIEEYDYSVPHLFNLNEDPQLSKKLYHNLSQINQFYIGRKQGNPIPQIQLQGIGVKNNHAFIERLNDQFYLNPQDEEASQNLYLNGEKVLIKQQLYDYDRIIFGISALFIFRNPWNEQIPRGDIILEELNWEKCQEELSIKQGFMINDINKKQYEEKIEKLKEIENKVQNLENDHQQQLLKIKQEHEDKILKMEQEYSILNFSTQIEREEFIKKEEEQFQDVLYNLMEDFDQRMNKENNKKQQFEKEFIYSFKERDQLKLNLKISKIQPNIKEANLISKELKRKIYFKLHLTYFYIDMDNVNVYENEKKKYRLKVEISNHELGYKYYWDLPKFVNRYYLIKDLYNQYLETFKIPQLSQNQDPFWDPPEYQRIGEGHMKLMNLVYLLDNRTQIAFVDEESQKGTLKISLIPINENYQEIDDNDPIFDEFIDDPNYFLDQNLFFRLEINEINIQDDQFIDIFIKYNLKFPTDTEELIEKKFTTDKLKNQQRDFKYSHIHKFKGINEQHLMYLLKNNVIQQDLF